MKPAHLALLTAALPFLCVHLSYLLAASQGHVPWCVPYWDSCTSISATGRELPEKLLFKLLMLPSALLALPFWWLVRQWLRLEAGVHSRSEVLLGGSGAAFLLLYVLALGESNDYRWARQSGIILFFALSYLAQLCFLCHSSAWASRRPGPWRVWRWQLRGAVLLLALGTGSVVLDLAYAGYDGIEDAVEWILMLCVVTQFCSHWWLWRAADLRVDVSSAQA